MRKVLFKQKTLPIEVYFIFDWAFLKIFVYFAQKILMMGGKQKRAEACFNYKQEAANKLLSLHGNMSLYLFLRKLLAVTAVLREGFACASLSISRS